MAASWLQEADGFKGLGLTYAANTFLLGPRELGFSKDGETLAPSAAACAKACSKSDLCQLWAWCDVKSDG